MSLLNRFALAILAFYKALISPYLGHRCRFYPTCSDYGAQCFKSFSFSRALWYLVARLFKCHPFCKGGVDPVRNAGKKPIFLEKNRT